MADAGDSKSPARKGVPVRGRPPAPVACSPKMKKAPAGAGASWIRSEDESVREVQAERDREEDGHLAASHRAVGAVRTHAAAARDSSRGQRLDVAVEWVRERHVVREGVGRGIRRDLE